MLINGVPISGRKAKIGEKDVITITNSQLVFTSSGVYYYTRARGGVSVDATDLLVRSGRGPRQKVRVNHVSLSIRPGELVAFVGGSGAGKSTLLSCVCGYLPPVQGKVYVNGLDLYRNYSALNKLIGYVPQSDIVFDSLTLRDMLRYTAKLRLEDLSNEERECAIDEAVRLVQMSDMKDHLIGRMSGGQRKRASIAVELLSNPNLLFLDEPCSGLDPGTERSLMYSLRAMADDGKTVILVTHSTLQLRLCDKVVFVGRGGNLCFFGHFDEALRFFGVNDVVDIYPKLDSEAAQWREKFAQYREAGAPQTNMTFEPSRAKAHRLRQFPVLLARNFRLLFNDRKGLIKQFGQTVILALLTSLVADGAQFEQYEATKSLFFILACVCCWIGLCMAIPEICKERSILRREYMAGLSPVSYILGKFVMLGALCLVHSVIVTLAFALLIGLPESGTFMPALIEMLLTSFLIALSSSTMGLALSAASASADKAMKLAPLLLVPQILFSGVVFALDGVADVISTLVVCRWGMEAYGATANLNELPLKLQLAGLPIPHEAESIFERTTGHMLLAWGILAIFTLALLALTRLILLRLRKEES